MKKLNKMLALFLSLVMLFSAIPLTVFAATENPYEQPVGSAEFSVSTSFCATGETTKIFVDISENSQMSAALFVLNYDTSLLKATNVETGLVLKNGYTSHNITKSGMVKVAYADVNPSYDAGRLFEVEFEVIGEIPDGELFVDVPVTLHVEDLRNYEDYKITPVVTDGKITMINTPYGDVNLSSDTTATDALMALYSNSQLIELTDEQKTVADVNGDGKVSAADALLILQYSAGEISNYPIFTVKNPEGLTVESKDETYISLCWNEVKNVLGYNLYMDGQKVNQELITNTSYTVNNLLQDTTHEFSVSAVNTLMETQKSDTVTVSTNKADRYVTFKDYNGTILNTQIVLSGENAILPANPTRTGYTFTGWDKPTTNILVDTEFTAQYSINTYTVTFDYQYNSKTASASAVYYTKVSAPSLISRTDWTLEGWYRDKNFVQKWNFGTDVVENNITLYAKWVTWSDWTTNTSLLNNSLYEVQSKTQYSYSDKSTTTSSESSLSGWTRYDAKITNWSSWSSWQNSAVSANTDRQVETRWIEPTYKTVYVYFHYCPNNGSSWANCYYDNCTNYHEATFDSPLTNRVANSVGSGYYYTSYWPCPNGCTRWYVGTDYTGSNSTRTVQATAGYTQYRYRTSIYTYYYYKWSSYSAWSDTVYTNSDTRQVKTRIVYRYKLKQQ